MVEGYRMEVWVMKSEYRGREEAIVKARSSQFLYTTMGRNDLLSGLDACRSLAVWSSALSRQRPFQAVNTEASWWIVSGSSVTDGRLVRPNGRAGWSAAACPTTPKQVPHPAVTTNGLVRREATRASVFTPLPKGPAEIEMNNKTYRARPDWGQQAMSRPFTVP